MDILQVLTIRQAGKAGFDISAAPTGASHVSEWSHHGATTLVWEKRHGRGFSVWDGAAWVNREAHYQARLNLNSRKES